MELEYGQVYLPKGNSSHSHRRVIGVIKDRVVYCYGGDKNRQCKVKTFLKWAGLRAPKYDVQLEAQK